MRDAEPISADLPAQAAVSALSAQRLRAAGAIALVLLPFVLFWPTTASLIVRWQDTVHRTYTHGYLVVGLVAWMLWRDRARLAEVPARMFAPGAVALMLGGVAWLIAYRAGLQIVHQTLLPLLIAAAILTCYGWALTRRVWLPLAYLYFAVPVWDALNSVLQWISVFAVRAQLRVIGIPAYFVDNTFQIPAGSFEIADGCTGLHFLVVALAIAVLYGEIHRDRWRTRALLIGLATLLAMATNWLRIVIIIIAGHLTDMQHRLVSKEHYTFGWFMFAGMMLIFFLIARRLPAPTSDAATAPGANNAQHSGAAVPIAGFVVAVAGLLMAPAWNLLDETQPPELRADRALPLQLAGWDGPTAVMTQWHPVFKGADSEEHQQFRQDGMAVEAYAAIYEEQRQGKEISAYDNSLLGPDLRARRSAAHPQSGRWTELRVHDTDGEWLLWYAYRVDQDWYSQALSAQLHYGVRSLLGEPLSIIVAVRTRCENDCEGARSTLTEFATAVWQ